ncbi:MAG: phenylalanine--tRNA ligase subunit alpha [Candidatus Saccharibacteria bacterium]|nr:phenylalanine--tRNA ligase subunit alpha [Candidatus Saccharibacteria bacterium]
MPTINDILDLRRQFEAEIKENSKTAYELLKDKRFKDLVLAIKHQDPKSRQAFGQAINELKQFLIQHKKLKSKDSFNIDENFDVTAPLNINQSRPLNLPNLINGSVHPIMKAQNDLVEVFVKMGFDVIESRQLDSQFYMFDSLNFPKQHPAREEFDNFLLKQTDASGQPLLAPAHTSTMQNRVLKAQKYLLDEDQVIACVIPGRVFRNEDVDASHDHMFYQLEGIYVGKKVSVANLIATLKQAMSSYFQQDLKIKIQPFYFPFTEPSFEFAISCPFCDQTKTDCRICGEGYIELLGCGLIHPNVLKQADIDSQIYTGFAWGLGLNRLTMLKYGIEDIRHFTSGKLEFLRQFK